ncbi:MAG: AGE family epimerase/isomerase [Promethearchaeota archaeon]
MTSKTLRKNIKIGFFGLFLAGLLLLSLTPGNSLNSTNNNPIIPTSVNNISNPEDQSSSDYTTLPYLYNSTPYLDWIELMINNDTLPLSPSEEDMPLYYAQSDRSGEIIIDNNHYLEDFVVFLDSFAELLGYSNNEILSYYQRLDDFVFEDVESVEKGYYSFISADTENNSTVKELKGNSQYILSMDDFLADDASLSVASSLITNQWDVLNDNFLDTDFGLYNHSSVDSSKYMEDQFLMVLSALLISQYDLPGAQVAQDQAKTIMELLIDEDLGIDYGIYQSDSFDFSRGDDIISNVATIRDLKTNAYGILALLEWYISDGLVLNSNYNRLDKAEAIFNNFYSNLWNEDYSLFMTSKYKGSSIVDDETIDVEANAIMMLALMRLYQVTGNFTYFQVYYDMFEGIESHLRDPVYGNYYTSLNSTSTVINDLKNVKTNSYLINSFLEMRDFAELTSGGLNLNATEFIKSEESPLNISVQYNFDFTISSGDFSAPKKYAILNATHYYAIRAPNGTIISEQTRIADDKGESYVIFNFTEDMAFGEYSVSFSANYTGISTEFAESTFTLNYGFVLQDAVIDKSQVRCGQLFNLNFSIDSLKENNLTVDIEIGGLEITNITFQDQNIVAGLLNNYTYELEVDQLAELGNSEIKITVLKDEIIYSEEIVSLSIISSISVISVEHDANVFRGRNFSTIVKVENMEDFPESVIIEFSGEYISSVNETIHLAELNSDTIILNSYIDDFAPLGDLDYKLTITRESDGGLIHSYDLTSTIKNPIEILHIFAPENSYHWSSNAIICTVQNNMDINQNISIFLDGEIITTITEIGPGENTLSIPIGDDLRNPYEFGERYFEIEIQDENSFVLYQVTLTSNVRPSLGSILLGYILPLAIPVVGIVVSKHFALENKKRLS